MVALERQFTRYEWPLFWCFIWDHSDRVALKAWLGVVIETMLFIRSGDRDAITVWYDPREYGQSESDKFDQILKDRVTSDATFFERLIAEYVQGWEFLKPYLAGGRKIKDAQELRVYCETWRRWWTPMALAFDLPNQPFVAAKDREALLALREETQEFSEHGGEVIYDFLIERNPSLSEAWLFMSFNEVLQAGEDVVTDAWVAEIAARRSGVALLNGELIAESDLESRLQELGLTLGTVSSGEMVSGITGSVASPGMARGVVKVVASYDDIDRVGAGDILVTEMTMPSFVPAMKRAAAIVTDEGGVTSHAAIVSRELGVPCVIGTRVVTQVLKDGDEVEVDADNGVVRVIKRADA